MTVDRDGTVIVADFRNHAIRPHLARGDGHDDRRRERAGHTRWPRGDRSVQRAERCGRRLAGLHLRCRMLGSPHPQDQPGRGGDHRSGNRPAPRGGMALPGWPCRAGAIRRTPAGLHSPRTAISTSRSRHESGDSHLRAGCPRSSAKVARGTGMARRDDAGFGAIQDIDVDAAGNVFVIDSNWYLPGQYWIQHDTIRKVSTRRLGLDALPERPAVVWRRARVTRGNRGHARRRGLRLEHRAQSDREGCGTQQACARGRNRIRRLSRRPSRGGPAAPARGA